LRPALLAGKAERPVYWRGDTHWNGYGAYLAYAEIMAALRAQAPPAWQQQPGLQTHPLNDYALRPVSYSGDLDRLLGLDWQPDPAGLQLSPRFAPQAQIVSNSKSESSQIMILETPGSSLPRLLVIQDSFGWSLVPYLAEHFSRSAFIDPVDNADVFELIRQEQPDFVILEVVERNLLELKDLISPK
jgi:hypothetical protein